MNKRIDVLRKYMSCESIELVIVSSPANMRYFADFTGEGYVFVSLSKLIIVTDSRYTEQARVQSKNFDVIDRVDFNGAEFFRNFDKIAFEDNSISYSDFCQFSKYSKNLFGVGASLSDIRAVKTEDEIEMIRRAESIGDAAFEHILDFLKPGVSERDIALEIEFFMRSNGAEALSFDTIVACGPHGAMPHAEPDNRKLVSGNFVVMDFGCKYNGYCSDMTRTVCIGKADDEKKKIYNTVLKAQKECIDILCEGVVPSDVHNLAKRIIDENYKDKFTHSLGHGIGLEIHENPNLSPRNNNLLKSGNVVTVEPGIYINGFCGVRIEDVVVICDNGVINLTKSNKNLIEI